jgi:hypothetical protein
VKAVFSLLLIYQAKHFLADYVLQAHPFFIGKFRKGWGFAWPLAVHCGIHAAFTATIALWWGAHAVLALSLAWLDFGVHFVMDRLKAGEKYLGRWKALSGKEYVAAARALDSGQADHPQDDTPALARRALRGNTMFWQCLGLDQAVHHLTHYAIIWTLLASGGG